jgi:hypothetical protein
MQSRMGQTLDLIDVVLGSQLSRTRQREVTQVALSGQRVRPRSR